MLSSGALGADRHLRVGARGASLIAGIGGFCRLVRYICKLMSAFSLRKGVACALGFIVLRLVVHFWQRRNALVDILPRALLNGLPRVTRELDLWHHVVARVRNFGPVWQLADIDRHRRLDGHCAHDVGCQLQINAHRRDMNIAGFIFTACPVEARQQERANEA